MTRYHPRPIVDSGPTDYYFTCTECGYNGVIFNAIGKVTFPPMFLRGTMPGRILCLRCAEMILHDLPQWATEIHPLDVMGKASLDECGTVVSPMELHFLLRIVTSGCPMPTADPI